MVVFLIGNHRDVCLPLLRASEILFRVAGVVFA